MIIEFIADGAVTSVKISAWAFMLAGGALCIGWHATEIYVAILEASATRAARRFCAWRAPKPEAPAKSPMVRRPWPENVPHPKGETAPASRRRH